MLARSVGPPGPLRGSPTPAAHKLAELGLAPPFILCLLEWLKQCAPLIRCRLHCSATLPGQENL